MVSEAGLAGWSPECRNDHRRRRTCAHRGRAGADQTREQFWTWPPFGTTFVNACCLTDERRQQAPDYNCLMIATADLPASAEAGRFTLSVVSHGQGALVQALLSDLANLAPPLLAQVIVTRNIPEAPIRPPSDFPVPLRFIDNPHPKGFGANHNAAFSLARSGWFAVVNPDIRLPSDPFPALSQAGQGGIGLVAPQVIEVDGRTADSARALPTPLALLRRHLGVAQDAAPPAWFAGMFVVVRREAFEAVGGFDDRYHLYCEDVDLCARLRLGGWLLRQAPEARVIHDARRASRRSLRHLAWHLESLARLWTSDAWRRYRALLERERRARRQQPADR